MTQRRIWTREELSEVFRINEAGELERLNGKYSPNGVGWTVVECVDNHRGYCVVGVKSSLIRYSAIIWILHYGTIEDTKAVIDHISGDKLDNRIENLRLVTSRENNQNKVKHRNGKLAGCYLDKCNNKWQAQIVTNSKTLFLGRYDTEQEAHAVYCKACNLIEQYIDNTQFRALVKGI
jgi:hypothetical protein